MQRPNHRTNVPQHRRFAYRLDAAVRNERGLRCRASHHRRVSTFLLVQPQRRSDL